MQISDRHVHAFQKGQVDNTQQAQAQVHLANQTHHAQASESGAEHGKTAPPLKLGGMPEKVKPVQNLTLYCPARKTK
jgi:hypothetical protein